MSIKLFDTFRPDIVAKDAKEIKADGYGAVALYIFDQSAFKKKLTHEEAQLCTDAGLQIVSVLENGKPTTADYFSTQKGNFDAHLGIGGTSAAGQTDDALYFTVDYDASQDDYDHYIKPYFQEINRVFEVDKPGLEIGCYGNGLVLMNLMRDKLITRDWLSQSKGFRDYEERMAQKPLPCIIQGPEETIFGLDADADTSPGDNAGGWEIHPKMTEERLDHIIEMMKESEKIPGDIDTTPGHIYQDVARDVINGVNPNFLSDGEIQDLIADWRKEASESDFGDFRVGIAEQANKLEAWLDARHVWEQSDAHYTNESIGCTCGSTEWDFHASDCPLSFNNLAPTTEKVQQPVHDIPQQRNPRIWNGI